MTGGFLAFAAATTTVQPTATLLVAGAVSTSPFGGTLGNASNSPAPANRTQGADTIGWANRYENFSPDPAKASVVETWPSGRQRYIAGSLAAPDGWSKEWSSDGGSTWTGVEPADPALVTGTRVVSLEDIPGNRRPGVVKKFAPPSTRSSFSTAGSGEDSYALTLYGDKVYSVGHHSQPEFPCFVKTTGASCGIIRPAGAGLVTGWAADAWVEQSTGRAYLPVQRSNTALVSCVDLDNGTDCGETVVSTDAVSGRQASVSPPWFFSGNLFFMVGVQSGNTYRVACMTVSTRLPCAGQPFAMGVAPSPAVDVKHLVLYASPDESSLYLPDGKVLYTVAQGTTIIMECFDSATRARCGGFTSRSWAGGWPPIVRALPTGGFGGLCGRTSGTASTTCYDQSGAPLAVTPASEGWMPKGFTWAQRIGEGAASTTSGSRSFVPGVTAVGTTFNCFDWASDAPCAGFPVAMMSKLDVYSLRADPYTTDCIWEDGHPGIVVSFHALTGALGCGGPSTLSVTVKPVYCGTGTATAWGTVRVVGMSTFGSVTVTVNDSLGLPIAGWSGRTLLPTDPPLDLSAIPLSGTTAALTIDVSVNRPDAAAWERTAPGVEATWVGSPLEACRRSNPITQCALSGGSVLAAFIISQSTATTTNINGVHVKKVSAAFDYIRDSGCAAAAVAIDGTLNGVDASNSPGVRAATGDMMVWSYAVSNVGATDLGDLTVVDDAGTLADPSDDRVATYVSGDLNGDLLLQDGEVWTFTSTGPALAGNQSSIATVTGVPYDAAMGPIAGLPPVTAQTRGFYVGLNSLLDLRVGVYLGLNSGGSCATARPYVSVAKGFPVTYCYTITNLSNELMINVRLVDPDLGITEANTVVLSGSLANLDGLRSVTVYYQTTSTGPLVNTASATATPAVGLGSIASASAERADLSDSSGYDSEIGPPT